jgi:hypothetical protein
MHHKCLGFKQSIRKVPYVGFFWEIIFQEKATGFYAGTLTWWKGAMTSPPTSSPRHSRWNMNTRHFEKIREKIQCI